MYCLALNTYSEKTIVVRKRLKIINYNIFRDNGIVISISVVQCSVECILMITCSFYIYFLNGYSKTFDKFFNIYLSIVTVIILPTFYLNGEAAFRRNLAAYGPFRALKNAIVGKLWMAEEIVFCGIMYCNLLNVKFIYSENATNFAESSPHFWLALHRTKVRWIFRKILWPSQNIWTLTTLNSERKNEYA